MEKIRLLLVDDHAVVRSGLRMLLENEQDLVILGEANTGEQALKMTAALDPHIVIMDISLPDISGIEVTRLIRQAHPGTAVVALTIHEDQQYFFEMLQAGASAYVPKRAAPDDLINAIRAVSRGDVYIYPTLTKLLVKDFISRASEGMEKETMNGLTPREQEVLAMLAEGRSSDDIAEALTISYHTVARHRENLMGKLGLHNRSELVKYAIRKGLIKP
ncbi:MAG: response regulator transcription factor [Chloroflexi bacterium]|nr:response regulator transcription factor [Chloroflexota bacterium]